MDTMYETEWIEKRLCEKTGASVALTRTEGEGGVVYREKRYLVTFDKKEATIRENALVQYILSTLEKTVPYEKDESLKNILLGESPMAVFRFMTRYHVSEGTCYALDVLPEKKFEEAASHVERCLEGSRDLCIRMDGKRIGVVKFSTDEQTPYEFGLFLSQSLYEELGIRARVGIGCEEKSFTGIARSYQQAVTAVRMSGNFRSKGDVHLYREFLLVRMLEEVPKSRLAEYFAQFDVSGAEDLFHDEELLDTAEQFLECNLNASETSRNLYMHRNTLMYRLDKIESATGLNIRNFSDAVTFRIVVIIYKLLNL